MRNTEVKHLPPVHVVAGIIRHPDHPSSIFITRRKKGQHLENFWEFPGGKVESGESRFHALQRELKEEIGIQVHSAHPFQSLVHQYEDKTVFLDVWEVNLFSGRAHGREGQEAGWMKLNELSDYLFPEADEPILKALTLPSKLLITPDLLQLDLDFSLCHFSTLMQKMDYPLVLFKSHHLNDLSYLTIAIKLEEICQLNNSALIIYRPDLNSYRSEKFDSFKRRHIDSVSIEQLMTTPFDDSIKLSISCQHKDDFLMADKLNSEFVLFSPFNEADNFTKRSVKDWHQFKKQLLTSRIAAFAFDGVKQKELTVARYQGAIGVAGTADFWKI